MSLIQERLILERALNLLAFVIAERQMAEKAVAPRRLRRMPTPPSRKRRSEVRCGVSGKA